MSPGSSRSRFVRFRPLASRCRGVLLLCLAVFACGDNHELLGPGPAAVARLAVTPTSATVIVDSLLRLTALATDSSGNPLEGVVVSWASSEAAVAAVDDTGLVRGVAPGLAIITAEVDAVSDSAAVTVVAGVADMTLSPDSWAMVREGTVQLVATLRDMAGNVLEGRAVTWNSSDTWVATVDSTGLVTGVGPGSATIMATSEGRSRSANVEVAVVSFVSISTGYFHSCGLTTDGSVYCWGSNGYGELGNATTQASATPVLVSGDLSFAYLSTGMNHACGVSIQGAVYCWGRGDGGRLGNGETVSSNVPVTVAGGLIFASVSAGWDHTCGVGIGGAVYCWGGNAVGQLGNGTTQASAIPVQVAGGYTFASVSAGDRHSCGVTPTGLAYCWGRDNNYGQLGTGAPTGRSTTPLPVSGGLTFKSIMTSRHHYTCGIAAGDVAYCWGHNDFGQLGRGWSSMYEPDVAPVSGGITFKALDGAIFHTCGVGTTGAMYCWGSCGYGGLGDGSTTRSYVPVRVAGSLAFSSVAAGYCRSCGITTAGIAYCWGQMPLGDGSYNDSPTPVRVIGQP